MRSSTPRAGWSSTNVALAFAAAASVGAAVWLSLQPDRLGDLHRIAEWTTRWLHGADLYAGRSDVDYPPWAIVALSPLALIPTSILPAFWVVSNAALLVAVARMLAGPAARTDRLDRTTLLLLIFAGALRTLNQFSLLSFALALIGALAPGRSGPLWLGLSLIKPQIGGVVWLCVVLQKRWRLAATSLVVPLTLLFVYALVAGVSPFALPSEYARAIAVQYADGFRGQTEITSWLRAWWPSLSGLAAALIVAAITMSPVFLRRALGPLDLWTLGLLGLCSLLSLRHLSYDFILLLPIVAVLRGPAQLGLALLIAFDPSGIARQFGDSLFSGSRGELAKLAEHADRVLAVGLWAGAAWLRQHDIKRHSETQLTHPKV